MNELQIFNSSEFGQIRTITKDNEPMFCLSDICKALEIKNATDVVKRLDFDEVTRLNLGGQSGETNFVTESGLYAVIIRSDKPNAKKFRKWVTSEVLPSIRKNGGYIANQENLTPEQIVANALVVAQNIILQKDRQIEEMQPKADFFDCVADSKSAFSMNEVAKVLDYKGIGRNKLFEFLREQGILDRYNVPYQRYVDNGWFRVIEQKYMKDGEPIVTTKTLVYQKGVDAIRKRLEKGENNL